MISFHWLMWTGRRDSIQKKLRISCYLCYVRGDISRRGRGDIEGKAHLRPAVASAQGPTAPGFADSARQELVRSHLPLVRAIARRYARRREELEDLVQAGSVGLVKASHRFDPSRGVAFATFAAPGVEGEIRRHLLDRASGVRVPREAQRMSTELRRCRSELAAAL